MQRTLSPLTNGHIFFGSSSFHRFVSLPVSPMEPAKIDWKNVQWKFAEDELYEHINAPKWVDFTAIHDAVDDEAWFCRPDCKHPRTAEELLRVTPSKLTSPGYSTETPQSSDRIGRDVKLKRRGPPLSSNNENQNPNFSTPRTPHAAKTTKAEIKSSAEKKPLADDVVQQKNNGAPTLKSTLSARNLFAGRDILNQITEFCNEIKRMATRVRERENVKQSTVENGAQAKKKSAEKEVPSKDSKNLEWKGKERKPFGELGKENSDGAISNSVKHKQRNNIKFAADNENIPISLDLEKIRHKKDDSLLQIRTNPPSPQCFSITRPPNKIAPSKASKSRLKENEILVEVEKEKQVPKEETAERARIISSAAGEKEARTLDVLWFLKPCTLSS